MRLVILLRSIFVFCFLALVRIAVAQSDEFAPFSFDEGWRFHRGGAKGAEMPDFVDSTWRVVNVPHDWSIENLPGTNSPFHPDAESQVNGGFTTGGIGWYRKTFTVNGGQAKKTILVQFDGVYMNAEVWINGQLAETQPYGYTTFQVDLSDYIKYDSQNVLAVKVRNIGENSRWYSGSGIYRHVWLITKSETHVAPWGVYITTPEVTLGSARVVVKTTLRNQSGDKRSPLKLRTMLLDETGRQVGVMESIKNVKETDDSYHEVIIPAPKLWSIETPYQYSAVTEVFVGEKITDRVVTKFGIRTLAFDVKAGFYLNGKVIKLKGACIHHDNGPLGARAFDRAEERKIEILKANGFNAIRCSHNPPSPALLAACDKHGILVIDEAFDMWRVPKNSDDYHRYFDSSWKKDIESMVLRDRNHPSVILWSIGNEIPERGNPAGVQTSKMVGYFVRSLDSTRLITAAVNGLNPDKDPYFATLGVSGYNYAVGGDHNQKELYEADHIRVPDRIIVSTESYPLDAFGSWMDVLDHPYVIGDFVWTGWDYMGEASIGWLGFYQKQSFYPWNLAYCGDIDICGWKRPQSHYRDALWKVNQLSIFCESPAPSFTPNPDREIWSRWHWDDVVDHWNWEGYENKPIEVQVYSSCDNVELFLNNKSLGRKSMNRQSEFRATWNVPYVAGTLRAVGYSNNKKVNTAELITAKAPVALKVSADRSSIISDGQDLAYVTIELVDSDGIRNFQVEDQVNFSITGPGKIVGVANANPTSVESYQADNRKAWRGRCMVIIQSEKKAGEIILNASSGALKSASIRIKSQPSN